MTAAAAVKLERERRKTAREDKLLQFLMRPEVLQPFVTVGGALAIQQLGAHRFINRDFAGFLLSTWVAVTAAQAGIKDKWALAAITGAAVAAYSVATPPRSDETVLELHPSKLLGGDGKLFWWDVPFSPGDA